MEPLPENHCESGGVEMEYAVSPTHRKAVKLQVRRRSVEQCSLSFSSEASLPLHLMETDQQKGNIAPECMYDGSFTKVMEAGGLTERIEKTCTKVQVEQKQKLVFVPERIDTPDINIVPCNDSRKEKEKERERNPILIDLTKSGEERHVVTSRPRIRTRKEELPLCSNTLLAHSCAGEEHDIKSSHKSATDCSQERVEMVSSLKTLELGVSEMSENFSRDLQNEIGRRTEKKDMNELLVVGTPDEVPSGQPSQPPRTISPLYKPNKVRFKLSQDTVVKRPRGRPRKNLNPPLQRKGFSDRRRARGRKKRAPSTSSESEKEDQDDENIAEGLIAASLGFPKHSLSDEEIRAGIAPSKLNFEQAEYVEVRNHILAKWREDVNSWLTLDTVMISIQDRFQPIVDVAYNFLSTFGYINFGVAPAMKSHMPEEPTEARVVVIGAGLAGLAAARQLKAFGHDVVVLEGRKRPGGRVFTQRMVGDDITAAADLGGSVLTGFQANPLGVLVRQLGLSLKPIKEDCPLYNPHGLQVDLDMDRNVQKYFNELLDRASRCGKAMSSISEHLSLGCTLDVLRERGKVTMNTEEGQLLDWHFANLEFSNAASLSNLSLAYWDQDDAYELVGDHCFVEGGNVELVEALAEGLTIVYDTKVDSISYGSGHVLVTAGEMHFQGEYALCTVPLGILKQGLIKFEPDLPKLKLDAIRRLGFGLLNKLAMLFPCAFWGDGVDTFGHVGEHRSSRGEYFLFYSYVGVSRFPLLIALVAGEAAITFERNKAIENVARVMTILGEIFKPKGISVPDPLQVVCTRWGKDQFTFGSYSNIAVGASGKDYDILAESVGHGRLYFAGEATSRHYPATMHGAFLSGLREAGNISVRAGSSKHTSCIRRELDSDIESSAHVFAEIFKKPDVEFGCFSVVFDLNADENNSGSALLKVLLSRDKTRTDEDLDIPVNVGSKKMSIDQLKNLKHGVESAGVIQQRAVHVYAAVTRKQALELMDVRGGDGHRLKYLVEALGVKLVGRKGLGEAAEKIVNARLFGSLKGFSRGNNT